MKIQRNSSNNYTTSFAANLKITGCTDGIKPEIIKYWEELAKDIGRDGDTVYLKFGKPRRYVSYSRGRTPIEDKLITSVERSVSNKVILEGGIELKNLYPSSIVSKQPLNTSTMIHQVNRYLSGLQDLIRK